jgi:hypothetical protein
MTTIEFSRPAALAARLAGTDISRIEHLFVTRRVLLRLEEQFAETPAARETLALLANEILRFCPNIIIDLPAAAQDFVGVLEQLTTSIYGDSKVAPASDRRGTPDAIVNVGTEIRAMANWITVNADGWVSRCAAFSGGATGALPSAYEHPNPFGALGAASLGAGQAFQALIGGPVLASPAEISLYTLEQGTPGDLDTGPELPAGPAELDVLLAGCGGVANGWLYSIRRTSAAGRVEAVDHQRLRHENLGAYVCATRSRLGQLKVQVARRELEPHFTVVTRAERFRFFQARFAYGQSYIPELVISALDNATVRHQVQRLWAPITIDLAAEGLTSQLIIKRRDDNGMCLIEAHTDRAGADAELAELAAATGLSVERLRDFESQITEEDIVAASPDKRPGLEEARRRRRPICGRVGDLDLNEEEYTSDFTPAVPFVTAFAGVVGAAQTLKAKIEPLSSLHFQFSFGSYRSRVLEIPSAEDCECAQTR